MVEAVKDAKRLFEVEHSAQDTFYVLQGRVRCCQKVWIGFPRGGSG